MKRIYIITCLLNASKLLSHSLLPQGLIIRFKVMTGAKCFGSIFMVKWVDILWCVIKFYEGDILGRSLTVECICSVNFKAACLENCYLCIFPGIDKFIEIKYKWNKIEQKNVFLSQYLGIGVYSSMPNTERSAPVVLHKPLMSNIRRFAVNWVNQWLPATKASHNEATFRWNTFHNLYRYNKICFFPDITGSHSYAVVSIDTVLI